MPEDLSDLLIGQLGLAPDAEQGDPEIGVPVLTAREGTGEIGPPAKLVPGGMCDVGEKIMAIRAGRTLSWERQQFIEPIAGRS